MDSDDSHIPKSILTELHISGKRNNTITVRLTVPFSVLNKLKLQQTYIAAHMHIAFSGILLYKCLHRRANAKGLSSQESHDHFTCIFSLFQYLSSSCATFSMHSSLGHCKKCTFRRDSSPAMLNYNCRAPPITTNVSSTTD